MNLQARRPSVRGSAKTPEGGHLRYGGDPGVHCLKYPTSLGPFQGAGVLARRRYVSHFDTDRWGIGYSKRHHPLRNISYRCMYAPSFHSPPLPSLMGILPHTQNSISPRGPITDVWSEARPVDPCAPSESPPTRHLCCAEDSLFGIRWAQRGNLPCARTGQSMWSRSRASSHNPPPGVADGARPHRNLRTSGELRDDAVSLLSAYQRPLGGDAGAI